MIFSENRISWRVKLGITLILVSALFYALNFVVFRNAHDLGFYILIDMAYIPLEVLFVILIVEWAISERERRNLLQKLNMVIGAFFSEVGTDMLRGISDFDPDIEKIRTRLIITDQWQENDFLDAINVIRNFDYGLDIGKDNPDSIKYLQNLKKFLISKRDFLLSLLANPNLLEHDTFTDLLWAVFHLTDELENRDDLTNLPKMDYAHLAADTERAYSLIIKEWLEYMEHLMDNYPYLFSLAIRTNPFDPDAIVEIRDIYS